MSCRTQAPVINVANGTWPNVKGSSVVIPYPGITFSERSRNRFFLRDVWNFNLKQKPDQKPRIGNFRLVMNAGDPLSRVNYSCGGPNMISTRPSVLNLTTKDGGQSTNDCDNTGVAPSTCNVKYVYDASDFIRYKKLTAVNRGYAGLGKGSGNYSGGGSNNGSQVAFRRVRIGC